jgi:hypothetical protein
MTKAWVVILSEAKNLAVDSIVPFISEIQLKESLTWGRMDAEFFQPHYRQLSAELAAHPRLGELAPTILHPAEIKRVYADNGVPYLLAQYIKPLLLDCPNPARIPRESAQRIAQNRLQVGDVVMTRTGANYGDCAVYLGEPPEFIASADCLVIRPVEVSGEYLAVWLNTKQGRALVNRGAYGASQPHIAPYYLRTLPVPRLGELEDEVSALVREAYADFARSQTLYPEAESELLAHLGWDTVDVRHVFAYETSLSAVRHAQRADAEHFQPKYERLIRHLERTKRARRLGDFCPEIWRGVQPRYEDDEVLVINSRHLGPMQIDLANTERDSRAFYDSPDAEKGRLRQFDVLLYSTGAHIGRTNVYLATYPALASNHVTIIRPDSKVCNPIYLALFLNSPAGLLQAEQRATGSAQREIYPSDIAEFVIYLPNTDIQDAIVAKVQQAARVEDDALTKLTKAKQMVEKAVG